MQGVVMGRLMEKMLREELKKAWMREIALEQEVQEMKASLNMLRQAETKEGDLSTLEQAFVRAGRRVDAVKEYRIRTRTDLKTAKDAVEAWAKPRNLWYNLICRKVGKNGVLCGQIKPCNIHPPE